MVREGQKRKNRGSSPKIDKSPQLAGLNNLNGSSPFYKVIIVINLITKGMILILGFKSLIDDHFCICMIIVITDLKQQVIISVIIFNFDP